MNPAWSSAYRLSAPEFIACWDQLGLGELPLPLELCRPGATVDDRAENYRWARTSLAARGLTDGRARPVPALAEALRLVAGSDYACDLRCTGGAAPGLLLGLGSVRGARGAVILRQGERIIVRPAAGPRVVAVLVELVGPLHPARLPSVNVPSVDFDAAFAGAQDVWTAADRLAARGVAPGEADLVARLLSGITSGGQLGATRCTDGSGAPRRGDWVIGYHRGACGACTQLRRPSPPHGATVTITPTTPERLFGLVEDLIRATLSA